MKTSLKTFNSFVFICKIMARCIYKMLNVKKITIMKTKQMKYGEQTKKKTITKIMYVFVAVLFAFYDSYFIQPQQD